MRQLNLALTAIWQGITALRRPRLLLPLLLFAVAQTLLLLLIVGFHLPPFVGAMAPAMVAVTSEAAVHYPLLFYLLPALFNLGNIVIGATLGAYLLGVTVVLVAGHFENTTRGAWSLTGRRLGRLLVAQIPIVVIALGLFFGMPRLLGEGQLSGSALRIMNWVVMPGLGVLVESLFVFVPMAILLEDEGPFHAIGRSMRLWGNNVLAVLLVVGIPALLHLPFGFLYRRSSWVSERFAPETVALVREADTIVFLFTNFLVVAGATLIFLSRRQET